MKNNKELSNLGVPNFLGPPEAPTTLYPRSLYSRLGLELIEYYNDLHFYL